MQERDGVSACPPLPPPTPSLFTGQQGYNRFFSYALRGLHISQASCQKNQCQFLTAAPLLSHSEGQSDKQGEEDFVTVSLQGTTIQRCFGIYCTVPAKFQHYKQDSCCNSCLCGEFTDSLCLLGIYRVFYRVFCDTALMVHSAVTSSHCFFFVLSHCLLKLFFFLSVIFLPDCFFLLLPVTQPMIRSLSTVLASERHHEGSDI